MKDYVESLLDIIGLPVNTVQVFEMPGQVDVSFLYPNYFVTKAIKGNLKDEEILDVLEQVMEEHLKNVQNELKMLKRYKKAFYGKETE